MGGFHHGLLALARFGVRACVLPAVLPLDDGGRMSPSAGNVRSSVRRQFTAQPWIRRHVACALMSATGMS